MTRSHRVLTLAAAALAALPSAASAQFPDSNAGRRTAFDWYDGDGFNNARNGVTYGNPYGTSGVDPYGGAGYGGAAGNDWYYDHYAPAARSRAGATGSRFRSGRDYRSRFGADGLYSGYGYDPAPGGR